MQRSNDVFNRGPLALRRGETLSSCLHLVMLALGTYVFSAQDPVRGCCAGGHNLGLDFYQQILNPKNHYVVFETIASCA